MKKNPQPLNKWIIVFRYLGILKSFHCLVKLSWWSLFICLQVFLSCSCLLNNAHLWDFSNRCLCVTQCRHNDPKLKISFGNSWGKPRYFCSLLILYMVRWCILKISKFAIEISIKKYSEIAEFPHGIIDFGSL